MSHLINNELKCINRIFCADSKYQFRDISMLELIIKIKLTNNNLSREYLRGRWFEGGGGGGRRGSR